MSWPSSGRCSVAKQIFETFDGQHVLVGAFVLKKSSNALSHFLFLVGGEMDHHPVGRHHALDRCLHGLTPVLFPKRNADMEPKFPAGFMQELINRG